MFIASNDRMVMVGVVACFNVYQHMPGETEENYKILGQDGRATDRESSPGISN